MNITYHVGDRVIVDNDTDQVEYNPTFVEQMRAMIGKIGTVTDVIVRRNHPVYVLTFEERSGNGYRWAPEWLRPLTPEETVTEFLDLLGGNTG